MSIRRIVMNMLLNMDTWESWRRSSIRGEYFSNCFSWILEARVMSLREFLLLSFKISSTSFSVPGFNVV